MLFFSWCYWCPKNYFRPSWDSIHQAWDLNAILLRTEPSTDIQCTFPWKCIFFPSHGTSKCNNKHCWPVSCLTNKIYILLECSLLCQFISFFLGIRLQPALNLNHQPLELRSVHLHTGLSVDLFCFFLQVYISFSLWQPTVNCNMSQCWTWNTNIQT